MSKKERIKNLNKKRIERKVINFENRDFFLRDDFSYRHEEVNISFYDPPHKSNGLLDLSELPVPKVVAPTDNSQ